LEHSLVLSDPPPGLLFRGFGENGLAFELSVNIAFPELMGRVKSDLYYKLWDVFNERNIEIPSPQRDLNLVDGWEKLNPDFQASSSSE
jgi:small-conductance mechanosensitive channel